MAHHKLISAIQILVIDDEPDLRTLYELTLLREGYQVEAAATIQEAWALLNARPFDLVITDKAMPNMNGEQLAVAIYAGATIVPVILMTGFGDLMKVAGELPPHISAILSKPITQESLREALAKVFPGK